MKKILILMLFVALFSSCKTVAKKSVFAKTAYLTKEIGHERAVLEVPKQNEYEVAVLVKCPNGKEILYKIQNTLAVTNNDGSVNIEGEKSKNNIASNQFTKKVKSGTTWALKIEFKKPITDGELIVKVDNSVVLAKVLTGDKVSVDYGFKLP